MAPAVGPYSPVFRAGDWLCISGQVGLGPDGLVDGFDAQVDQALDNLGALLDGEGVDRNRVAKTTVFLVDMDDYAHMNERYTAWFGDHRPARSAVAVAALPLGALVEIEAWVHTG
jgi:2-iminobutanoate/2-iminopropanoate deaminase